MTSLTTESIRRAWVLLGVALVLLWGVPQSVYAAPASQTITGYVQNADLRRTAQATVELRDKEGTLVTSATTTDAGAFTLITPREGVFSVHAVQDTYKSEHVVIEITQKTPDPVVLTLTETKDVALEIVAPLTPIKPNSSGETYSVSRKDIEALPRGNNVDLHDVLATIPSAITSSLKQVHIRQEHANLQFRIDGVPIPDTVTSQFTDLLSPRAWERADILLGGLEAQYGVRTTAVIDITSKSGTKPGFGSIGVYGGSNETVLPSFEYGGTAGDKFRYYVMNNYKTTNRAIDPPTLGQSIYHGDGESNQTFLRGDYQIDNRNNLTLLLLNSVADSEIPTEPGQMQNQHVVDLIRANTDANFTPSPSEQIDENQVESNQYSHLVWRHDMSANQFVSVAGYFRHSRATFTTDPYNVLAYTGGEDSHGHAGAISAANQDRWAYAGGIRLDYTHALNSQHMIKAGFQFDGTTTRNKNELFTFLRGDDDHDMDHDDDHDMDHDDDHDMDHDDDHDMDHDDDHDMDHDDDHDMDHDDDHDMDHDD
ncbi:MAG: TonB-dependent receptor, partial [Nitrospira sp. SB0661_bin_20]|nr:TonB-dependent receptor [Nitrospira sp. SB0661_bin_20]